MESSKNIGKFISSFLNSIIINEFKIRAPRFHLVLPEIPWFNFFLKLNIGKENNRFTIMMGVVYLLIFKHIKVQNSENMSCLVKVKVRPFWLPKVPNICNTFRIVSTDKKCLILNLYHQILNRPFSYYLYCSCNTEVFNYFSCRLVKRFECLRLNYLHYG